MFSIKDDSVDGINIGKYRCLNRKRLVYFLFSKCEKGFFVMFLWEENYIF